MHEPLAREAAGNLGAESCIHSGSTERATLDAVRAQHVSAEIGRQRLMSVAGRS
jgi:hypothetical protein